LSRILLIDDSEDFRVLIRRYISSAFEDFDIVDYDPKDKGLPSENFPWKNYDLVLLDYDLGLGRENGLGWLIHFSTIPDIPPIIMITAVGNTKVAVDALKSGAIDFIDKGDISADTIKATLEEVLSLSEKQNTIIANRSVVEDHINEATISEANNNDADTSEETHLPDLLFHDEPEGDDFFNLTDEPDPLSITDDQMEKFGLVVPGYELLKEIGRGGMSVVLLAKPVEEDREVVLKIMFTEGHEDPLALKRFMQEYTLISCLDHPHIVAIDERAFASDFAYIAMENFPGGDLAKKLQTGIDLETAIEYIRQMCMGLVAVHDINIVHRDIKPGNILFRSDGTLAITDFGAAKNLTGDVEDITINNHIVGTPYYMSPEQAASMPIDHRSDLYSLGIMIYQMLTNERPYTAKSIAQLISMHLNAPIPKLPGDLAKYQPLIDGLLAKDPDDRFQSANDVILGLDWIE
jgi:eukaryotic-like serine/threonine-protein kinase